MAKKPREYQEAAINSFFDYYGSGKTGNSLIVAPVGAGKSLILSEIIKRVLDSAHKTKIVVLSHVMELLVQDSAELFELDNSISMGFYCAGLGKKDIRSDVVFASIQSIYDKASIFYDPVKIIIIDEAHLISHNNDTSYRRFISDCKTRNPNLVVLGLTGTAFRSDTGRLDSGDGKLFDDIIYEIPITFMLDEGYLVRPTSNVVNTKFDLTGVGIRGGDYVLGQLSAAVDVDEKTKACVSEIIKHGKNRNKWLVFAASKEHCLHIYTEMLSRGISVGMVTSDTPREERDKVIQMFRSGVITCMVNVAVLTTGFNVPDIDLLAFLRPTRSPVLYIQCIGRGMRPVYAPGFDLSTREGRLNSIAKGSKPNCLVLDFGEIIQTLGPIDCVDVSKVNKVKEEKEKEPQEFKRCPACGEVCYPQQSTCYVCEYRFVEDSAERLTHTASSAALLSDEIKPERVKVFSMITSYSHNLKKQNSIPNLRVTYSTILGDINDWICFNHPPGNYARLRAESWHKQFYPGGTPPVDVNEALDFEYPKPAEITVKKEGKWYKVLSIHFDKTIPDEPKQVVEEDWDEDFWK